MLPKRVSLALLLLAACTTAPERERDYQAALAAARTQPAYPVVGAGLRLGMPEAQAEQHLDSLRARDELVWHLSTGPAPMEAEPEYARGKLLRLQLRLEGSGLPSAPQYQELRQGLAQAYGGPTYVHGQGNEDDELCWFRGGTQVQLLAGTSLGYAITYSDVHQVHALAVEHQRRDSLQRVEQGQPPH